MDPTYFMQSQDLRTTDDDIADPINERLTLAERNERLQNQLRSLKEDLSHTRDETGQLLPIAGFSCCLFWYTNLWFFSPAKAQFSRKFWFGRKFCCDLFFFTKSVLYCTFPFYLPRSGLVLQWATTYFLGDHLLRFSGKADKKTWYLCWKLSSWSCSWSWYHVDRSSTWC